MAVVNYTNGGSAANALANQARPYGITPSDRLQTEQLPMSVLANLLAGNLDGMINVKSFGAVGDGVADDTAAINAATAEAFARGGGMVYVPPTDAFYRITNNIVLRDNVGICGAGYASHIRSFATTGYSRNPIITGNIGDITGGGGFYNNTQYDLLAIDAGSQQVTFVTAGDASTFEVGDVVGIQSFEKWPLPFPDDHGKYINLNEVVDKDGAILTLKYPIPDEYPSSVGNRPTIARLDGTGTSYNGEPEWVAKNCIIRDLRITQNVGGPSFWYGIFLDGIGHLVENVWMDDVSTMIGSNALAQSTIRNMWGRYDGGIMDFADFQCNNLIENVVAQRVGRRGNVIGFALNNGADVTCRNLFLNLGWYDNDTATFYKEGRASAYLMHRTMYDNTTAINADGTTGAACAILAGFGDDVRVNKCRIIDSSGNGIVLAGGPRTLITDNVILGTPSGNAIIALTAADEYIVRGNVLGEEGSRTSVDTVAQSGGFSANAYVSDNVQFGTTGSESDAGIIDPVFVQTSSTSSVVLKTYSVPAGAGTRGFRISASGERSGVAGIKTVRLVIDPSGLNQTIAEGVYTAGGTTGWYIQATVLLSTVLGLTRATGISVIDTVTDSIYRSLADDYDAGVDIELQAFVANGADAITVSVFTVEVL